MTADGYFRTGDVAVMLPDGQVKIVDRMKDMILISGFNVYPNEVEDVIAMHPGVMEFAVIGVPGRRGQRTVAAYVVRKDPTLDGRGASRISVAKISPATRSRDGSNSATHCRRPMWARC